MVAQDEGPHVGGMRAYRPTRGVARRAPRASAEGLGATRPDSTGRAMATEPEPTLLSRQPQCAEESSAQIEIATAKITTYTANKNTLEENIAELQKDIASLSTGM